MTPWSKSFSAYPVAYLTSDGSEDKSVGAFALAVAPNFVCSAGNGDEDQTPYKQELLGFHLAATAVAEAASRSTWQGRAVFALDCKAALRTATSARVFAQCGLRKMFFAVLRGLLSLIVNV